MPQLKVGKPLPEKKIDLSSIIKENKEEKEDTKSKKPKSISVRPEIEKETSLNVSARPSGEKIAVSAGKEFSKDNKSISVNASKEVSEEPLSYQLGARIQSDKGRSASVGYGSDKTFSADYSSPKGALLSARYNPETKSGGASYSSPKGRSYSADIDTKNKSVNLDYTTAKGAKFSLGGIFSGIGANNRTDKNISANYTSKKGNFSVGANYGTDKSVDARYTTKKGNTFTGSYNAGDNTAKFGAILNIGKKRK